MGIMDNVTGALSRGSAAAERTARTAKLKADLKEVNKRRQGLAAQLGASLYATTKGVAEFYNGREALYDGIAECDCERDAINRAIVTLQEEASAEEAARQSFTCVVCGASVRGSDLFCSGCGTPADKARKPVASFTLEDAASLFEATQLRCKVCGASLKEEYAFCMGCGSPVSDATESLPNVELPDSSLPMDEGAFTAGEPAVLDNVPAVPVVVADGRLDDAGSSDGNGAPTLLAIPALPACPSCGSSYSPGQLFCMSCGLSLSDSEGDTTR